MLINPSTAAPRSTRNSHDSENIYHLSVYVNYLLLVNYLEHWVHEVNSIFQYLACSNINALHWSNWLTFTHFLLVQLTNISAFISNKPKTRPSFSLTDRSSFTLESWRWVKSQLLRILRIYTIVNVFFKGTEVELQGNIMSEFHKNKIIRQFYGFNIILSNV